MSVSQRRNVFRIALGLLALLPTQLAIEFAIAYFFLPRQTSAILKAADGMLQIDHVRYSLADVPLTPFTFHLAQVTGVAFLVGVLLGMVTFSSLIRLRRPTI